jgi:antitoxin YefM
VGDCDHKGARAAASPAAILPHDGALVAPYLIPYKMMMRTTSYSELRRNLAAAIDRVAADHEPVMITRDRGKPAAILMSVEDFASYEETRYLLQSPANAARLLKAVADFDQGLGSERELIE